MLGELDGNFQNGFKKDRSTVTAMLELQDFVATELDAGNIVGTYSIDLSAAFDLLRPDMLYDGLRDVVPKNLLEIILNFLSSRKFKVELNNVRSTERCLKVGCVQGSILGPRLFTLYMRNLEKILPEHQKSKIIAYADDTYVSISGKSITEVKESVIATMSFHDKYLRDIGMKTNVSKTELIFFKRQHPVIEQIVVNGCEITSKDCIKVLGTKFQHDLTWDKQIDGAIKKGRAVISKLKFLSRLVDRDSMKKIVTTHFFGMIYYGCQVWLNETTTAKQWKLLNSIHYRALRTAARDYHFHIPKAELNSIFNRATPLEWMMYSNAKMAITLYNLGHGPPLTRKLREASYINDRRPGTATISDRSRLKIGKQSLVNRLNCLKNVLFDWTTGIDKNALRINLKKTFIK